MTATLQAPKPVTQRDQTLIVIERECQLQEDAIPPNEWLASIVLPVAACADAAIGQNRQVWRASLIRLATAAIVLHSRDVNVSLEESLSLVEAERFKLTLTPLDWLPELVERVSRVSSAGRELRRLSKMGGPRYFRFFKAYKSALLALAAAAIAALDCGWVSEGRDV